MAVILFGLPFYFGYGNPLPFANSDYALWDNIILFTYPLIFIGFIMGWKYERVGGYLIITPLIIGLLLGIITEAGFMTNLLISLIPGVLYLLVGYNKGDLTDSLKKL